MSVQLNTEVTPVERAGALDNSFRRLLHNPKKIVAPYIKKGMTVLDLGCGPGFFTLEIAKLLDGSGKVIAADLQQGMLEKVKQKFTGHDFEKLIYLHKCSAHSIHLTGKIDFVLAFYCMHEVSDQDNLIRELIPGLHRNSKVLVAEQKFHVPKRAYEEIIHRMIGFGFEIIEKPKVFLSRAAVMRLKNE